MVNEKRLIYANALKRMFDEREAEDDEMYGVHIAECFPADDAKEIVDKCPTVDAVEVVLIKEVSQKILETLDNLIAVDEPLANDTAPSSYYRGKVNAYEVARRLVNAALTDLCNNSGAKMDGDGNG